ncbi:MAG: Trk system potassium transporter TrkA [Firmicutes bacterium]|nr:Trk system potassium transporter TrkA [Bacillota bacterium]
MKIAIVGAGKLGTAIAEALIGGGHEITLLDSSEERSQNISQSLDVFTITADAKQTDVLKDMRINEYDVLISTTDNDEKNILVCAFAKKLGCRTTIARVRAPEHVEQLEFIKDSMGIDFIINPDKACADEIFKFVTQEYAISGGKLSKDGVGVLEFRADKMPEIVNRQLRDAKDHMEGLLIAAISREGKVLIPNGSSVIHSDDIIYTIGLQSNIDALQSRVQESKSEKKLGRIMIAGGGNTGYFLAKQLIDYGASIKILELSRERCEYLSSELSRVLVLNADATDTTLLREENLQGMDAFIALTGFDEENLLLSMIAKQNNVPKIVAKISRKSYDSLTSSLGNIMIINPLDICSAEILHMIRKDGVVLFSQVINGQAEFREIMATADMPMTEKTLSELVIPEGVLFAAIERDGVAMVPNGSTQIAPGDKVLILSMLSSAGELESLLSKGRSTKM